MNFIFDQDDFDHAKALHDMEQFRRKIDMVLYDPKIEDTLKNLTSPHLKAPRIFRPVNFTTAGIRRNFHADLSYIGAWLGFHHHPIMNPSGSPIYVAVGIGCYHGYKKSVFDHNLKWWTQHFQSRGFIVEPYWQWLDYDGSAWSTPLFVTSDVFMRFEHIRDFIVEHVLELGKGL
jgi:hypothetical protein